MAAKIYVNGQVLPGGQVGISPYDHGFLYGHGLFETMRSYQGRIFRLDDHLARLIRSSRLLGWNVPLSAEGMKAAINTTLAANDLANASIRLTVSRGQGAARPDTATCGEPSVIVFAAPYRPLALTEYEQGWSLATVSIRRNPTSPLCKVKSANYLENILARAEARQSGAQDGLLLNTSGYVAESTIANVFFVASSRLVTPDCNSGILSGIARAVVFELAAQLGIIVEERPAKPSELLAADEIFLTNSLLEIMAVTKLDGRLVGSGQCGAVTSRLRNAYQDLVREECFR